MYLSRSGYVDMFDEWCPSDSWTGTEVVRESLDSSMNIRLHLRVVGVRSRRKNDKGAFGTGKCRPVKWTASLSMDNLTRNVISGSCKSLKDAVRQVEALDLDPHIEAFLRVFYSRERGLCIWTRCPRPSRLSRVANEGWTPFVTLFAGWGNPRNWNCGSYLVLRSDRHTTKVKISTYFSEESNTDIRMLGDCLSCWT